MTDGDVELHGPREEEDRDAADLSNEELREEFFEQVESDTKESTAQFYKQNFRPFLDYIERGDGHLTEGVGHQDIKEFLEWQAEDHAPKTVQHRHSTISRFYNVLDDKGLIKDERELPTELLDRKNVLGMSDKTMSETGEGKDFHYLDPDEVGQLIENVPAPELRNRTLVMLMANTGVRASEVIRVRIDDDEYFDLDEKRIKVRSPKLTKHDNDPKWINVYWRSQKLTQVLKQYIEFDRPSYPYADESIYLFPSQQSERIHYDQVNRIVKQAAENAGLQTTQTTDAGGGQRNEITSHVLRHSYAMAALENGMSIDEISENLHHSDISVTMKYLRRHEEDRKRAVEQHGPQFG